MKSVKPMASINQVAAPTAAPIIRRAPENIPAPMSILGFANADSPAAKPFMIPSPRPPINPPKFLPKPPPKLSSAPPRRPPPLPPPPPRPNAPLIISPSFIAPKYATMPAPAAAINSGLVIAEKNARPSKDPNPLSASDARSITPSNNSPNASLGSLGNSFRKLRNLVPKFVTIVVR